eukprot:15471123-Alexandrium_andersonii.AAC.1
MMLRTPPIPTNKRLQHALDALVGRAGGAPRGEDAPETARKRSNLPGIAANCVQRCCTFAALSEALPRRGP